MPLLGESMLSAAAHPTQLPGVVLPPIAPHSDGLHTVLWNPRRTLTFAFFAPVLAHVAAPPIHTPVRRDGVFQVLSPVPTSGRVIDRAE